MIKKIALTGDDSQYFDFNILKNKPVEDWPVQVIIDFLVTISIFSNLHLLPQEEFEKYMDLYEIYMDEIESLKEFS